MKESKLMLLQYLTGAGILFFGALHFADLTLPTGGLPTALEFVTVKGVYLTLGLGFELFLALLTFHVFNGFRKVLVEVYQGKTYERAVSWIMLLGGGVTFIWGTRTILIFLEVLH
jgi:succinate dehydrogenase / fumarate reductase membrane anchor subunit